MYTVEEYGFSKIIMVTKSKLRINFGLEMKLLLISPPGVLAYTRRSLQASVVLFLAVIIRHRIFFFYMFDLLWGFGSGSINLVTLGDVLLISMSVSAQLIKKFTLSPA